jgi:energy-converting hydrogenase Eha subunit A
MSTTKKDTPTKKSHKKAIIITSTIVGLYVISLFVPFISNYTQFPLYVIKCGGRPVVANIGGSYDVPGSSTYQVTGLDKAFFCSEKEAKAAGYRKIYANQGDE